MDEWNGADWRAALPIALVVPGDCQVDDEFWRLLAPAAIPFVSRTTGADQTLSQVGAAVDHLIALAESSDLEVAADRLRAVNPVAAAYVDTSISFVRGPGGDLEIAERIQRFLRVPTIVTSTAVLAAFRALGARRVAVVSVYPEAVDARIAPFFEPQGVAIARIGKPETRMEQGDVSEALAHIDAAELIECGAALDGPDVDAIFIPCTAVRTLEAIEPLEARTGRPVVTAIQATMWAVARLAGISADAPSGGRLFEVRALPAGAGRSQ
jgi:maleate cis-trans isomerase